MSTVQTSTKDSLTEPTNQKKSQPKTAKPKQKIPKTDHKQPPKKPQQNNQTKYHHSSRLVLKHDSSVGITSVFRYRHIQLGKFH